MALTKTSIHFRLRAGGIGLPSQVACAYPEHRSRNRFSIGTGDAGHEAAHTLSALRSEPPLTSTLRDIILQVKENADIVQVIGQYVPLRKAGSRYLGLCPFHHDRS